MTTQVTLKNQDSGKTEDFDLPHAERILALQKKMKINAATGYILPTDSPYALIDGHIKPASPAVKPSKSAKPTESAD